jgi:hypothetical protein
MDPLLNKGVNPNNVDLYVRELTRQVGHWLAGEPSDPIMLRGLAMDLYELPPAEVANPLPDELVRQLNACTGGSQLWKLTYFPDRRLWEISAHFRGDDGWSRCSPDVTPRLAAEAALRHYRGQGDPADPPA